MSESKHKIVIKAEDAKGRQGHIPHTTGSGPHKDKRTKRNRTRSDKKRNAIKEQLD